MKNTRKLIGLLLLISMAGAGCGDDDGDAVTTAAPTAAPTTAAPIPTTVAPTTTTTTIPDTTVLCTDTAFAETVTGPFFGSTGPEWAIEVDSEQVWAEAVGDCQGLILPAGWTVTFGRQSADDPWETVSYEEQ